MNSNIRTARDTVRNPSGLIQISLLNTIPKLLEKALEQQRQVTDSMKQELSLLENSRLQIHKRNGKFSFTCIPQGSNKGTGITKDNERIHLLARRHYLESSVRICELRLKKIQRLIDASDCAALEARLTAKLHRYADAHLDLSHILFTKDQNEWIDQAYSPNPFHRENLRYATRGGLAVRSKSEAMIGNYFEMAGLPYRSDDLVSIISDARGERPNRDTYFADFKVPNLLGGITIHEHFGAFQIENYSENALQRLNDYQTFKVMELPGRPVKAGEFTWSFENDLTKAGGLESLALKMLLPGI